jgi:hypothetical protein
MTTTNEDNAGFIIALCPTSGNEYHPLSHEHINKMINRCYSK